MPDIIETSSLTNSNSRKRKHSETIVEKVSNNEVKEFKDEKKISDQELDLKINQKNLIKNDLKEDILKKEDSNDLISASQQVGQMLNSLLDQIQAYEN